MTLALTRMASGGLTLCLASSPLLAQEAPAFTWGAEVELGVDTTFHSDDPAAEFSDVFAKFDLAVAYALTDRLSAFAKVALEPVISAEDDRAFDDMGAVVNTLGLRYEADRFALAAGKIAPAFGIAWDVTPGYFGTSLAEDYETSKAIGAAVDLPVDVVNGQLQMALFYIDDTRLSDSFGTRRGRLRRSDGGAGNTGKLNNIALHWQQDFGSTTLHAGARHLQAGNGDVSDETGVSLGVTHGWGDNIEVMGELATFNGFGGSGEDVDFATLGMAYSRADWTYSAAATLRDEDAGSAEHIVSVGADYDFDNGAVFSSGLAFTKEDGASARALGLSITMPFGQ
jgi:hypothetical protein